MRFREKFRDFKNRLTDRHMYSVIVGLIIVMVAIFSYQAKVSADYKNRLDSQYIRAFDDLTEYVSTIETSLFKCAAVTEPKSVVRLAGDIYAKAASASVCLGQLPLSDAPLENTAKFLSQVGDFTYMLSLGYMDNPVISDAQRKAMLDLSKYAVTLEQSLYEMQQKYYSGALRFGTPSGQNGDAFAGDMEKLEAQFQDYPSLIYDGPFSDHVQDKESVLLKDKPEVSKEDAENKVKEIISKERIGEIKFDGEVGGNLPTYMFTVFPDDNNRSRAITVQISKKGGMVIQMLDNREVTVQNIDIHEAKQKALAFLKTTGFNDMRDSYFEIKENIATINFAYAQANILYYSDLVKVKIAMDSGEVLGLEAGGYAANHGHRAFSAPEFTMENAKKRLSPALFVENAQLAVIPRKTQDEAFCWEFKCRLEDKTFLIYINTENGKEEDILMLIETEGGMLTI